QERRVLGDDRVTFAQSNDLGRYFFAVAIAIGLFNEVVDAMACPHAIDFRIGGLLFRKAQFSILLELDSVHAAANTHVGRATVLVSSVNANGRAMVKIWQRFRLNVIDVEASDLQIQSRRRRAHQLATKPLGLAAEVVLARKE